MFSYKFCKKLVKLTDDSDNNARAVFSSPPREGRTWHREEGGGLSVAPCKRQKNDHWLTACY